MPRVELLDANAKEDAWGISRGEALGGNPSGELEAGRSGLEPETVGQNLNQNLSGDPSTEGAGSRCFLPSG